MKRLILAFSFMLLGISAAGATDIKEVTSAHGITAWLVEDHALPLMSIQFAFRGGLEQDPAEKQGLANLTMNLLTEGAGTFDAAAFQQQLADSSISMRFDAGRDALLGSVKFLSQDKDTAANLLHLALAAPRFDKGEIERLRHRQLAALRAQMGNPEWQARYALFQQIFAHHPYGQRRLGSTQSIANLTRSDVRNFAVTHMARDNLIVAVAGDISPGELKSLLDQVFGDLPRHAKLTPVGEVVWPEEQAVIAVPREGTQTELLFAMPGPKRDSPDWFAAEIANYILGGGGFSSRLMQDVRDSKGLTYGIDMSVSPMEHGGMIVGEAATDNPKTAQAWDVALDTMRHFYRDGATEKEINAAKDYLTGSLALAMTSTDAIAGVLVEIQLQKLGIHYLDRRNNEIDHVTTDEVDHAIQRWFNPGNLTLTMVGKPDNMQPTQTREQTRN